MYTILALSIFLFLPHDVVPEESTVYEYGPDSFKQQIEDLDGNFIMFYAPWWVILLVPIYNIYILHTDVCYVPLY